MRRAEKEITSREEIDTYIGQATVCRVGLCDGGEAYIVPMDFGYVDGRFYFHSAKEGRKVDLIRNGGRASFELEVDKGLRMDKDAMKCTHHFICVMGTGTVSVVEGEQERMKGLRALMEHYTSEMYQMTEKCKGKTLVLKLTVETVSCKKNG